MKTWLPGLRLVLYTACQYMLRNNIKIKAHLPPTAAPAIDACVEACQVVIVIIDGELPSSP